MTLPNDTYRLKRLLTDPRTVLGGLGLLDGAKRCGRGFYILCPWHLENTPSCCVREGSDGTLAVHCFGCSIGGDVFTLIAQVHSLDPRREFPRVVAEAAALCGERITSLPPQRRPAPSPRTPPPRVEVKRLWASCAPITDDIDLARQLKARNIDPDVVTDRHLARALPSQGPLPRWARGESQGWQERHRCILPLWNPAGELVSLHARAIAPLKEHSKGLLPAGYSARGLFLADACALQLLKAGILRRWPRSEPPRIFIAEGGIDFLTIATHYSDAEDYPAILGILAGSWSDELAQKIPPGCCVAIKTHEDEAGRRYRDRIAASIRSKCRVLVQAGKGQADA